MEKVMRGQGKGRIMGGNNTKVFFKSHMKIYYNRNFLNYIHI